jgi:hypothetical protein
MKTAFIAVVLLLGAAQANAQETLPDSCLTLNWNGFSSNPDSIYVDTCLTTHRHPVFWDKGPYSILFDTDAIHLGYGAPDSDLEVGWQAIDTAFPLIRNGFKSIADSFGVFTLRKISPSDTSGISSRGFYLIFQNYVSNDSVTARLDSIPGLGFELVVHWLLLNALKVQDTRKEIWVFPNPAKRELHILSQTDENINQVRVMDALGRTVYSYLVPQNNNEIILDLSKLSPGCYCICFGKIQQLFIHE